MKKIIITVGISGSGKSVWAKEYCKKNANWLRINRDDLRKSILLVTLNEYHTWESSAKYKIEKLVTDLQNKLLISSLRDGWNVVLDNTHLKMSFINEYKKLLGENFEEFEIEYKFFETSIEECIVNDLKREDNVGENVILEQFQKLKTLKKILKIDSEISKRDSFVHIQNDSLPKCVLVDIDGTVADKFLRSPFEWHKVGQDLPKNQIIRLVKSLKSSGNEIIFFSGRDEVCMPETMDWICEHFEWNAADFQIFMRKNNDQRKDSIIKFELFEKHIKDKYYVELVVDDRQQVVDMWRRKLGLTCLQVDYGDF